jgi:hypothetical protein
MAPFYSEETIRKFPYHVLDVRSKQQAITLSYLYRRYRTEEGRRFASHGYLRRLTMLAEAIEDIHELLPPAQEEVPDSRLTRLVATHLQAFYINVFGCLDNLAWVWVYENRITKHNGQPLHRSEVGLRSANVAVRNSMPDALRQYLDSRENWIGKVTEVRDALAHRIPLYIPPHFVDPENAAEYTEIENKKVEVAVAGDLDKLDAMEKRQQALQYYRPVMVHSAAHGVEIAFHAQTMNDFLTAHEMGEELLKHLSR